MCPYSPTGTGAVEKRQKIRAIRLNPRGGGVEKYGFGIGRVARVTPYYPNTLCVSRDFVSCQKNSWTNYELRTGV